MIDYTHPERTDAPAGRRRGSVRLRPGQTVSLSTAAAQQAADRAAEAARSRD